MTEYKVPSSVLIIGSGAFGLSTALSLCAHSKFRDAPITLVERQPFPAADGASIDTSRLIRADYADPAYARLALKARQHWRGDYGANGRYHETGVVLSSNGGDGDYVSQALDSTLTLQKVEEEQGVPAVERTKIRVLHNQSDIRTETKLGTVSGEQGYINYTSGWADSEMSVRYMRTKAESLGRIKFVTGTASRLLFSPDRKEVMGAVLEDGQQLTADLTVVAAGAWSSALLDLRGIVSATGQVLAYVELSREEQDYLSKCPVQLDLSSGMFFVSPPPLQGGEASRHNYFKIARHGYGYSNPVTIPHPESSNPGDTIRVSLPHSKPSAPYASQTVPDEAMEACRKAIKCFLPSGASSLPAEAPQSITTVRERPFAFARLCHYADTPTGNFLISYHPKYNRTLFVATGGSGHGFKFAPVLGDEIVKCILGECHEDFTERWAWPSEEATEKAKAEAVESGGAGWEGDGSRGGTKGLVLDVELGKSRSLESGVGSQ